MLLGTLGVSLLGNLLACKGTIRASTIRTDQNYLWHFILSKILKHKSIIKTTLNVLLSKRP